MESIFINVGLLAGIGLASLPVILHLFMRPTPKKVIFPTLQLVRERHKRAKKSMKIKNWLLLAARMLLVALMALALARPRFYSSIPIGDDNVPKAVAFVIDTSLSMQFTEKGKDRLTEAKDRIGEVLLRVGDTSKVFLVDSADPGVPVGLSPASSRKQLEAMKLQPANRPLNAAIGLAYEAVAGSDRLRKEVYVLTDLTATAWDFSRTVEGLDKVKDSKAPISTFVLQLSAKELKNAGVIEAETSSGSTVSGDSAEVRARIRNQGPKTNRVVEFKLDGQVRDKKTVDLPEDGEISVNFTSPKLEPGLHRGEIFLTGGIDGLTFDDSRVLSFQVAQASRVLVVSDLDLDGDFIETALDPDASSSLPESAKPYIIDRWKVAEIGRKGQDSLRPYAAIFLNNVARVNEADWSKLGTYVRDGGGLVVSLGNRVSSESYITQNAVTLLPGALENKITHKEPTTFAQIAVDHPLFAGKYTKDLAGNLGEIPVLKSWRLTPHATARPLISFSDGSPALLERTFKSTKTGRVLMWAVPLSRRPEVDSPEEWTDLPLFFAGWYLMRQTLPYLSGVDSAKLNYEAGEDVIISLDPVKRLTNYVIQGPDQKNSDRQSPSPSSSALIIPAPAQLGQWTVTGSGAQGGATATLGFSVNPSEAESRLRLVTAEELDKVLGKDNYSLADNPDDLRFVVDQATHGRELYPWVMFLIMILLISENLLANKFHREVGRRPIA